MARLILSDREIGLIKGLIIFKQFNDQQVVSIFSYLHRNINHREIGSIRRNSKPRYAAINAAPPAEIDALLYEYSKIASLADRLGFCEMDPISAQIHKSIEIMKTAILVYNNNIISTRSETFIVLAIISWTYLFHAKLLKNNIEPAYRNNDGSYVLIDGRKKLWDASYCIERPEIGLKNGEKNNLRYILAIRHEVEHRSFDDINADVQSKIQACALNFLRYAKTNFGDKFDFSHDLAFTIQLQALTLKSPNLLKGEGAVAKSVAAVNATLETAMSNADYNDPDYAFRVYVVPKVTNNSKKADQAVSYSPVGSNVEMAIKHVERPKYRMSDAIAMLTERGVPAVTSYKFINAWKDNDLKNPAKNLAIELGNQWFWYQEGIDEIARILTPPAN